MVLKNLLIFILLDLYFFNSLLSYSIYSTHRNSNQIKWDQQGQLTSLKSKIKSNNIKKYMPD